MRYNQQKLRRLNNAVQEKTAIFRDITQQIQDLTIDIRDVERIVKEADQKTELAINRENYLARTEGRSSKEIEYFLKHKTDELLELYPKHPIKAHLSRGNVERYVALKLELDDLRQRQNEISEMMKPAKSLLQKCNDFLEANGVQHYGKGLNNGTLVVR